MIRSAGRAGAVGLMTAIAAFAAIGPAAADSPFASLAGSWSGQGKVQLEGGKSEAIRCRAYYNPKEGGRQLGLAIRCASTSYKMEIRASLFDNNGRVTGTWEERTFNTTGHATGRASTVSACGWPPRRR